MEYNIQVGEFNAIITNSIIVSYDNPAKIILENGLTLEIMFLSDDGEPRVNKEVQDKTLRIIFLNINRNNSIVGVFEPAEIGYGSDGNPVFFSCVVSTESSKNGNRLITFTFWNKRSNSDGSKNE